MKNTYITDVAKALTDNHAALMVGAGFSKNAEKLLTTDKKFLNWNELSDLFYDSIHGEYPGPGKEYRSSLRLAQEVEVISGRPKLESILKEAVPDLDYAPSELYTRLMELPWVDVFTTNYDTLLERAADTVTLRRYNVVVSQEDLVNSNDAPRIIKLHGSFPSHRPFIITEEDYRTYPVRFAALVNTVQQALLENIFCMIGFSCEDPNFIQWIGWIHDNLGKSSSQKIYMISVTHVQEATSKLLFEQNIIIIDLQELWPDKDISGRISGFLDELKEIVAQKEKKDNWFSINGLSSHLGSSLTERTNIIRDLNDSYPGWIFLPWKMKKRAAYVLRELEDESLFEKGTLEEQIVYMYEFVRFADITGRPILFQTADTFWTILTDSGNAVNELEYKVQIIFLQLLRAFRELAQWEDYDACRKRIKDSQFNYDDKQFLYACDWWQSLYRFNIDGLSSRLDEWSLSKGDLYWPLIKASMYAIIGEFSKASDILSENLILLRQKLFRSEKKEYLSSIEESCVSLINFIRQRNFSFKNMEESIYKGDLSWWNENDKYCLHLNSKDEMKENGEKVNFNLSVTYTTHYSNDNTNFFYALEYLRFIEQSGHPFRLGNVTNTKGLEGTIERLVNYYPHLCLMHSLIAQDTKHLDLFFGRVQLANKSQEEVDAIAKEYVRVLQVLIQNVDPQNHFSPVSIYEQSAVVMPGIIARLCYKCSADTLDLILDEALNLCRSSVRANFKGVRKLLEGLIHAYTREEQTKRINKILMFPMDSEPITQYLDPLNFVSVSEKKLVLSPDLYDNVMYEIRRVIASENNEQREDARNRLVMLYQIVELNDDDKDWLFNLLEEVDNPCNKELLYFLRTDRRKQLAKEVFDTTINKLEADAEAIGIFSGGGSMFGSVFSVLKDLDEKSIDYVQTFCILKNFAGKNRHWSVQHNGFEARERMRLSFLLLVRLVIKKTRETLTDEELQALSNALNEYSNFYHSPALSLFRADFVEPIESEDDLKNFNQELWQSDRIDIELIREYYDMLQISGRPLDTFPASSRFWNKAFSYSIYKILGSDALLLSSLRLCYSLLKFHIPISEELSLLILALNQLIGVTTITDDNTEQEAIYKLQCRILACRLAQLLFKNGYKDESICQWKEISENKNEFAEVRAIVFK